MFRIVLTLALSVVCTASAIAARPAVPVPESVATPGITRTAETLDDLRARFAAATVTRGKTTVAHWSITSDKDVGTETLTVSDADFHDTITFGGVTRESGSRSGQHWLKTANGVVVLVNYQHPRYATDGNVFGEADDTGALVELLGERAKPSPTYAVRIDTPGGRVVRAYFDEKTALPNTIDVFRAGTYTSYVFDDYRTVDGVTRAYHVHAGPPSPGGTDFRMTSFRVLANVPVGDFDIPAGGRVLDQFPAQMTGEAELPVRFAGGDIVVRATVGTRGLDFLLDSGTGTIALDTDTVRGMGLAPVDDTLRLPEISVGPIAMRDIAVDTIDFSRDRGHHTKVVGILGFDFLAHAIVRIDYEHSKVFVSKPQEFHPNPDWLAIPIALDQLVPVADAEVGAATGHFIVDTGDTAGTGIDLFSHFIATHADDVRDQGRGDALRNNGYRAFGRTVNGVMLTVPREIKSFTFANLSLDDFITSEPIGSRAFQGEDFDGLIGYGILRLYDVIFDYPDGTIYLAPNATFRSLSKKP